jgi:hypothetical protein
MLSRLIGGNAFQAKPRDVPPLSDCTFYHSTDLRDHDAISGPWDLRGREREYLGYVDLKGRSVIEYGPASGHLTYWMEQQGADVTVFETSNEVGIDLLPKNGADLEAQQNGARDLLRKMGNAWWRAHHFHGSNAKRIIGNIYDQPKGMGTFDIATTGMLLIHCKSPFDALHNACAHAREAVVVTDFFSADLSSTTDSLSRFNPSNGAMSVFWWQFSPGWVANVLRLHGFGDTITVLHKQRSSLSFGATDYSDVSAFTVVGRRAT